MNADLRVVSSEQFPFALNYFTGSKEHNVNLRQRAIERGLKLNEYALEGPGKKVRCMDEAEIYRALDLEYVSPEMREQTGEVDAAATGKLPRLIEPDDIKGVFHCHTTWSDGTATLEEMAAAARELGFHYLGIADHSPSLTIANGLTPDRVKLQGTEIDGLRRGQRAQPLQSDAGGDDGTDPSRHQQSARDDAGPRHGPAAPAPRRLQG
jgi:DNA polymerase (family 10)